jgi:hypothetical protein
MLLIGSTRARACRRGHGGRGRGARPAPGGGAAGAAARAAAGAGAAGFRAPGSASTSCLVMRPPAPVPFTFLARSRLFSRAIRRTSGEKGPGAGRLGLFLGLPFGGGGGSGRRLLFSSGSPSSSVPVRAPVPFRRAPVRRFRFRFRLLPSAPAWRGGAVAAIVAFLDARHHGVDPTVCPLPPASSASTPEAGDGNLGVHFVGRDLEQRLVALDAVAGLSSATWSACLRQCSRPSGASLRRS